MLLVRTFGICCSALEMQVLNWNGVNPSVLTCFGQRLRGQLRWFVKEPRFVEELNVWSVGQAWPRLPFETTGSLPRADSLGVSSSAWFQRERIRIETPPIIIDSIPTLVY